jgi:hypothetical protein
MSNAQAASVLSVFAGVLLLFILKRGATPLQKVSRDRAGKPPRRARREARLGKT